MEKQATISVAKISAPKTFGMVERERLFRLLDQGREKSVIWADAPAGSGGYPANSVYITYMRLMTEAYFSCQEADDSLGGKLLREAMAVGACQRKYRSIVERQLNGSEVTGYTRRFAVLDPVAYR